MQHNYNHEKSSNLDGVRMKGAPPLLVAILAVATIFDLAAGETNRTAEATLTKTTQLTGYDLSRLTPERRKELAQRLLQYDAEFLRWLTNSLPAKVAGGTNR